MWLQKAMSMSKYETNTTNGSVHVDSLTGVIVSVPKPLSDLHHK